MSRSNAALMASSAEIWQITTVMPDPNDPNKGLKQFQTYRTQSVGANSVSIDTITNYRGVLAIWMTLQLAFAAPTENVTVDRLVPWRQKGFIFDVWAVISSFAIGMNCDDIFAPLNQIGSYALCLRNPDLLRSKAPGLFPVITFHPNHVIEAVFQGDFKMVSGIMAASPEYLLLIGTAVDFSGRTFTGTPLQAALACGDFDAQKNFPGIVEMLMKHFKKLSPGGWKILFTEQALELYKKSLIFYIEKQNMKIETLRMTGAGGITIAIGHRYEYLTALGSNDLTTIFNAHITAQQRYQFDFGPAIDAIRNASDQDIQAVLDDPEALDTPLESDSLKDLRNTLKQSRSAFTAFSHDEKIVNLYHLLSIFRLYDSFSYHITHFHLPTYDNTMKKRQLFWCHLVGWVERNFSTADAQIIANLGFINNNSNNEFKNLRSVSFRNTPMLPSFDTNIGIGRKFATFGTFPVDANALLSHGHTFQSNGIANQIRRYIKKKEEAFTAHVRSTHEDARVVHCTML